MPDHYLGVEVCARLAASDQSGGQTAGDSLTFKLVQATEADQFFIRDDRSGLMLFAGRVEDPS